LAPLTAIDAAAFVSLQKPVPALDTTTLASAGRILDLAADLTDFGETAAVIANLDLVVMIDSSVAHLAGAMGKPVWVLLPEPADWRWLKQRADSPWYPDMRLFRQPQPGAWETPISAAADALQALARKHRRP
jgi:ADP-heptose:LPS heptosyltransferase